jgi:5'-methylthioadenosine phosphorylase
MTKPLFGVMGGSGVYDMEGLENPRWEPVDTPWGAPSSELLFGEVDGETLVFLPRHGKGHRYSPTDINFRANIDAMKRVGVRYLVSMSAVGSLRENLHPGDFVIVDQFIDRTFARVKSFFGEGCAAHVSMAHPVCGRLGDCIERAAGAIDVKVERGGTYIVMEGPQFSTKAESFLYRQWQCDVVGMTNMPEAKLAREAEISYATVAMVTDYDCWHEEHDHVTVDQVIQVLKKNADHARALVQRLVPEVRAIRDEVVPGVHDALDTALITQPQARDPELMAKLDAVAGRVLSAG